MSAYASYFSYVRRPRISHLLALAAALILFPFSTAAAQEGAISGSVTDENGAPLGFVQVTVRGTSIGAIGSAGGDYRIEHVAAGSYTVVAQLIGHRSASADVTVIAGETVTQDFTLGLDQLDLEAIVVTGTRQPMRKIETSTAITTMTDAQIEKTEPRSTADLLKSVPGYYVESSGGEVNNNLFVRGLPADGSYRYVIMMENGMPAFDPNDLFFLGADNLVRVDENVQKVEATRGGASALFGSNAPGGLVNLIDKTGGPELAGSFKLTGATHGMTRYDMNVNGPLAEDWLFSFGGYYRFDDGVRDPGFPAARGGQLKANLTRNFDRGYVRLFAKYINDRNVFFLPLPRRAEATGDVSPQGNPVIKLTGEGPAGFPDDATLTTNDANFSRIPLPSQNGEFTLPLENGVAQTGGSVMAVVSLDLDNGWNVKNSLRFMSLMHQNNAMPPGQSIPASEFAQPFLDNAPVGSTAEFTFQDTGMPFDTPNGLVDNSLLWHVERPISNFSNQFVVSKAVKAGTMTHNISFGGYFGFFTADNKWMFNNVLTNIQNAPLLLNLNIRGPGGNIVDQVTENGFTQYLGLFVNTKANGNLTSFFAGDQIQASDRLRLDLGVRIEHDQYINNVENTSNFDLGGPSDADNAVNFGNRSFTRRRANFTEYAASIGLNYMLSDQAAVYVRGSRGYKMPLIDQFIFAQFPDTAETLYQAEGGIKVGTPTFGLSALGYWVQLQDFPSQDLRIVNGQTVFETALVGKSRTIGFEFEGVVSPYPGFQIAGQATVQDHEYLDFIAGGVDLAGNYIRRIPKVITKLGASYANSGFAIGGDWYLTGKRFSNNENTVELPTYSYGNARLSYTIPGQGITLSGGVSNLNDGGGLTEGDPRFDESGAPVGFGNGRPILPRRWTFSLRYDF